MKIDYSQLQTYISCPRKYYNRYKLCLRKAQEDEGQMYLNWGKALHAALEVWYREKDAKKAMQGFLKDYVPLPNDKVRTTAHGLQLLTEYFNYYSKPTNELGDSNLKVVEVEKLGSYQIQDIEVVVKIDLIAENNAGRWVIDHKFTTKSLYTFINTFSPNMQVSNYVNYVRKQYGQCSGFIPNVVSYGHREKAYKGEPPGFHWRPERDIVCRDREQLLDFEEQFYAWCLRIKQSEQDGLWPKNENSCSLCGFKALCLSCDDETVKETLYEKYDPFNYLKGENKDD